MIVERIDSALPGLPLWRGHAGRRPRRRRPPGPGRARHAVPTARL